MEDLTIIVRLSESRTQREVTNVVIKYLDYLNAHPYLFIFVKAARHRISLVEKEKKQSWKTFELN